MKKDKKICFSEKLTDIYICFMLTVYPLCLIGGYSSLTKYKFAVFSGFTVVSLAVLFVGSAELALVGKKSDFFDGVKRLKTLPTLFFALYMALVVISFLLSSDKRNSLVGGGKFDGVISELLYFAVFLLVSAYGKLRKKYIILLSFTVAVNFILCILQLLSLNPFWLFPRGMNYYDAFSKYSGEFLGTFGNVDVFSAFFAVCVPIFLCFIVKEKHGKYFYIGAVSLAMSLFMLIACKVLSGMIAAVVSMMIFPFMSCFKLKKRTKIFFLTLYGVIAALLAVLAVSVFINSEEPLMLGSGRLKIWLDAVSIFCEKPIFGCGVGTFAQNVSFSFERELACGEMIVSIVDTAHNIYLQKLCTTGVFSLIAYLGFVITLIKKVWRKNSSVAPIAASYLVIGMLLFEICTVTALFYIMCGLAVTKINEKEEIKNEKNNFA